MYLLRLRPGSGLFSRDRPDARRRRGTRPPATAPALAREASLITQVPPPQLKKAVASSSGRFLFLIAGSLFPAMILSAGDKRITGADDAAHVRLEPNMSLRGGRT